MRVITFYPQTQRPEDVLNRISINGRTPEQVAGKLNKHGAIRDCMLIQSFGMRDEMPDTPVTGDLFRNRGDRLPDELRPHGITDEAWEYVRLLTPWHNVGIAQWSPVAQRIANGLTHQPAYLIMDVERGVWPLTGSWHIPMAYTLCKQTPEWHRREVWPGMTMSRLCRGVPDPDPRKPWGHVDNRGWALKVFAIYQGSMAYAMKTACYVHFTQTRCCNYQTDQVGAECRWHSRPWLQWPGVAFGNMSSPVLYKLDEDMWDLYGSTGFDALIEHTRFIVSQGHTETIGCCPWIFAPGEDFWGETRQLADYQRQVQVCQDAGAELVMAWGYGDADWEDA